MHNKRTGQWESACMVFFFCISKFYTICLYHLLKNKNKQTNKLEFKKRRINKNKDNKTLGTGWKNNCGHQRHMWKNNKAGNWVKNKVGEYSGMINHTVFVLGLICASCETLTIDFIPWPSTSSSVKWEQSSLLYRVFLR